VSSRVFLSWAAGGSDEMFANLHYGSVVKRKLENSRKYFGVLPKIASYERKPRRLSMINQSDHQD
jgi:hypothetical protein